MGLRERIHNESSHETNWIAKLECAQRDWRECESGHCGDGNCALVERSMRGADLGLHYIFGALAASVGILGYQMFASWKQVTAEEKKGERMN